MALNDPTPTTYAQAERVLNEGRNRESRKIGNNTWLERRGKNIAVRLHHTDVVTWSPNGTVTFRTGGWDSTTTRERLNRYAPGGIGFAIRRGRMVVIDTHTWDERPMPAELTVSMTR